MRMKLKKPICLVGLMGAGKTTVGGYLAKRLDLPFYDSDSLIEEQAGITVSEIFERDGEEFFRKVEAKTIEAKLSSGEKMILATGGGAFINEDSRNIIKEYAESIWLYADLKNILERVEDNDSRPLLNNGNKEEILQKLIDERYPIYKQADIMVDTSSNSRTVITNDILEKLGSK